MDRIADSVGRAADMMARAVVVMLTTGGGWMVAVILEQAGAEGYDTAIRAAPRVLGAFGGLLLGVWIAWLRRRGDRARLAS